MEKNYFVHSFDDNMFYIIICRAFEYALSTITVSTTRYTLRSNNWIRILYI